MNGREEFDEKAGFSLENSLLNVIVKRGDKEEPAVDPFAVPWVARLLFVEKFSVKSGEKEEKMSRIITVYFTHSGNTEKAAALVQKRIGGDLFRLETLTAYPAGYTETTQVAKREQQADTRPELKAIPKIAEYDTVVVCYPNWWSSIPMPLFSFFEAADFSGKTIAPLCTHGGGGLGRSESDIRRLCPGAVVTRALALAGTHAAHAETEIAAWLAGVVK